ncbi:abortive phage resistance protein [Pantoea agglomerans]|uniref:AbiTii domain-containing protein n=1 Tax=Enterobacter agglomerans TaxID=549 RepID=UPI00202DA542|nr:abortive phage resistance protein [Pantoea agglomerans]MCL6409892.1 abortive phage resistance protein [Pantoea agglomerans]
MKDSPVLKLQAMASSKAADLEDVLLKAQVIATKLKLTDILSWIHNELYGYPENAILPKYRVISDVPVEFEDDFIGMVKVDFNRHRKELHEIHFRNPISMLIDYSKLNQELSLAMPEMMRKELRKKAGFQNSSWVLHSSRITIILTNIRMKILEWTHYLESIGIYGDGLLFSAEETKEAQNVIYNITNNNNGLTVNGNMTSTNSVVGGTVSHVQQQNIIGDFNVLERQLKEYGIDDSDINELKGVIDQMPNPETKEGVEKSFGAWIGKMTGKAFTGAIKIAGAAAPALLTNFICHHYGIPV